VIRDGQAMVPGPGAAADSIELKRVRQEVQREVRRGS
jgi:hypothetical protein